MATAELIFKITPQGGADFKSTMAQVRSELGQTASSQKSVNQGDLSMRQQLAAVQSLQRQRSAALIGEWKRTQTAASNLAKGVQPVSTNLQRITDIMQTLGGASASLQGPLGGVAGRLRSVGALATEAGGGLGAAGVAVGVLAVATVGLAVALFKATSAAAEFQGKMFDLSQQVGVSVELLSALEIGASTTGGSIDTVTQSVFNFQRKLEDAQDPTSNEAKLLKSLGIETNNTEEALRQAFAALSRMPEGFRQTDAAASLFGARGGKQVLAILKEWQGDIDGTMKRLRAMGILITTEQAQAADKFNDQLAMLSFQFRALTAVVGNEAMPTILSAVEKLSDTLSDNQDEIKEWVSAFADAAKGVTSLAQAVIMLGQEFNAMSSIPIPEILRWIVWANNIVMGGQGLALFLGSQAAPDTYKDPREAVGASWGQRPGPQPPRVAKGGKKGRTPRDTSMQDDIRDADLAERKLHQKIEADIGENKRALDTHVRDIQEFTRRAIELAEQRHAATIDRINKEQEALDTALARRLIKQREYNNKDTELRIENTEAAQKFEDEKFALELKRDEYIAASELAAHKRSVQLADEASERLIAIIQERIDRAELAESEGQKQIAEIIAQGFERRKILLEDEENDITTSLERKKEINDELIRLDGERADAAVRASRRIIDALQDESEARARAMEDGGTRPRRVGTSATRPRVVGKLGEFDELREQLKDNLSGDTLTAAQAGVDALAVSFDALGQAVGSAVQAFILYGKTGTTFRKVAAEIIAAVAMQATTKAIFELAEGFAALARMFFGDPKAGAEAALHFKSAAIYGSIAGIAAATGRAVAGNSFQDQGSESSGVTSTRSEPERDRTRRESRQGGGADPNQVIGRLAIDIRHDDGVLETRMVKIVRRNGSFRSQIRTDLLGEANG